MGARPEAEPRFRRRDGVAWRELLDEVLLVPVRRDSHEPLQAIHLNRTAAHLWLLLDRARTVVELVASLCERFAVEPPRARTDVEDCLRELLACDAIEALSGIRPEAG